MLYQLRNRTYATNADLTSPITADTEAATDGTTLNKRLESRRLKRGLRRISEEGANEFQLPLAGKIVAN